MSRGYRPAAAAGRGRVRPGDGRGRVLRAALAAVLLAGAGSVPAEASAPALSAGTDSLLAFAREAGHAGRHPEAIEAYRRAALLAPDRYGEIGPALAFQYAWAGELDRAREEFRLALADRPGDYDLRMGELLVVNWMGNHLEAWAGYEGVGGDHPGRAGPLVGAATAQNWVGRRDLALANLDSVRVLEPENRDALLLEDAIRRGLRPAGGAFYDWADDSDHYQVNGLWAEGSWSADPQWRVTPHFNLLGIRHGTSPEIDELWLGATATARPLTPLGLRARLSVLVNPEPGSNFFPVTGTLSGDWLVHDALRAGLSLDRFAAVSYRTFPEKITGFVAAGFVEARPDWLTRVRFSADRGRYDAVDDARGWRWDPNHRWNLRLRGNRQVWSPARLRVGGSAQYLNFAEDQDNGVWTPDWFWAGAGTAAWDYGPRGVWSFHGHVEPGLGHEKGGSTDLYLGFRLGYSRTFGAYTLEAHVGHTEGNVETGSGYDRSYAHLGVRRRF